MPAPKYTFDGLPVIDLETANRCTRDIFEQNFIHSEMEKIYEENRELNVVFTGLKDYITYLSERNPEKRKDIERSVQFGAALIYRLLREQSAENMKYVGRGEGVRNG